MGAPEARPLLLAVDGEAALARGLEVELRRGFAADGYDTGCADSAEAALELARAMRNEGRDVALVVVDNDISGTGTALVNRIRDLHPRVRTLLLIRHPDLDEANEALHAGILDNFFVKPIRPPEEQLVPAVSDLLGDWETWQESASRGVHVIGREDSEGTQSLREFLHGNDIHHHLLDARTGPGQEVLANAGARGGGPVVVLDDGTTLLDPSLQDLARELNLATSPKRADYDLASVGGGPAGLAAAVYGASEGLETVCVERHSPGGQAGQSARIENYLGFPGGLTGLALAQRALKQSKRFQAEIVRLTEAIGLEARDGERILRLASGSELRCRALLIASGVSYRRLEAPGIDKLVGRGVFYGAGATDARDWSGRRVAIVGGANSAGQAAVHFAEHGCEVTMLVRAGSLRKSMSHYLVERISEDDRIGVRTETEIVCATGDDAIERLEVMCCGAPEAIDADGVFIFIGAVPRTEWLEGAVTRDERGFILTGRDLFAGDGGLEGWPLDREPFPLETSVPGIFVAGDVRHGSIKRVASAVGEGAMAVQLVHGYLEESSPPG